MTWQKLSFIFVFLLFLFPSHAQTVNCTGSLPSRLVLGQQARVIAEGGSNLRSMPNVGGRLLNIIPQNTLIPIIDGPFCADGYAWWQVDYEGERGWLAEGLGEFYWLAPYVIQQAQIGSIRLETLPDFVSEIRWERLGDPLRSQFVLAGFPVSSPLLQAFIVIFDAPTEEQLEILEEYRQRESAAKFLELETAQFSGWRFVEVYYPQRIQEAVLIYHFMGLSVDNHFIDAYFPLTAPNLPLAYDPANTNYLEDNGELIDNLEVDDIQPNLAQIDLLIQSLRFDAPLAESNLLNYEEGGIRFSYNPILAYSVEQSLVLDATPAYIEISLLGYPIEGDAKLRVYRASDLNSADLARLQQSLSRQPSNPPLNPLELERPSEIQDLGYLRFGNGDALRYLSETQYHLFGLTDNREYYLILEFPISFDTPSIETIEGLIASLEIGTSP